MTDAKARSLARFRGWMKVGMVLGLSCGAAVLGLHFYARAFLAGRVTALEEELAAARAHEAPRTVLLGEPTKGNAAVEYRAIEWVLDPRQRWSDAIPDPLPFTALPKGALSDQDREAYERLDTAFRHLDSPGGLPPSIAALARRLAPLRKHILIGLSRDRCFWDYEVNRTFDTGYDPEVVHTVCFERFANVLEIEAAACEPTESVTRGLEIVLFGRDIARHPSDLAQSRGLSIQRIGLRSLLRSLKRPIPDAALDQVIALLGRIEPVDSISSQRCIRLATLSLLARLRDQLVDDPGANAVTGDWVDGRPTGLRVRSMIFLAWEWWLCDALYNRIIDRSRGSYSQRVKGLKGFRADILSSRSVFAPVALRSALNILDRQDETNARLGLVRLAAAARRYQRAEGRWPDNSEVLGEAFEQGLPLDPYKDGKEALKLKVEGEALLLFASGDDAPRMLLEEAR